MKVKPRPLKAKPRPEVNKELRDKISDDQACHIASMLRKLSGANLGGLQLHVWPSNGGGFQGNVKVKTEDGWSVGHGRNPLDAIEKALEGKMRLVR